MDMDGWQSRARPLLSPSAHSKHLLVAGDERGCKLNLIVQLIYFYKYCSLNGGVSLLWWHSVNLVGCEPSSVHV